MAKCPAEPREEKALFKRLISQEVKSEGPIRACGCGVGGNMKSSTSSATLASLEAVHFHVRLELFVPVLPSRSMLGNFRKSWNPASQGQHRHRFIPTSTDKNVQSKSVEEVRACRGSHQWCATMATTPSTPWSGNKTKRANHTPAGPGSSTGCIDSTGKLPVRKHQGLTQTTQAP